MKTAIIGLGVIAPVHIRAIQDCEQDIVAVCDVDSARCQKTISEYGLTARAYTNYVEMLEKEKLDAVHVCTPHHLHAQMCCEALKRGVNVLCEKPLAITKEQLDEIGEAVKNSTATLGVCHQQRYRSSLLYVRDLFKGREITGATATLVWNRNKNYYQAEQWRGKWATEGGGVMINQAIHYLDILQWFCGYPETVIAHVANNCLQDTIEVEDTAYGIFSLENGGKFIINATTTGNYTFPVHFIFQCGDDRVEVSGDTIIHNGQFVDRSEHLPIVGKAEYGGEHFKLIKDYYDCISTGKKFLVDYNEGRKIINLVLKMYQSQGKLIAVEK